MTISRMDIYRTLLLEKRAELIGTLSLNEDTEGAFGECLADSVDLSARALETAVQARLQQNRGKLLRAIEAALRRIDRRTFGVCETCRQPIPVARLNAVPWADLCRDCKEQHD